MQDANSKFYVEKIECSEKADFDRECVTVIDGAIYTETPDGILRMDCFFDEQITEKKPAIIWIHGGGLPRSISQENAVPRNGFSIWSRKGIFLPVSITGSPRYGPFLHRWRNANARYAI